jgi:hypothetical protein
MRGILEQASLHQVCGVVEHGDVEHLDLWFYSVFKNRCRQAIDEIWRVLI